MAEDQNRTWNDRYMLRLPDGMRDRIKAAAEANNRSMNAEIVARLEQSFAPFRMGSILGMPEGDISQAEALLRALDERVKALEKATGIE